jgi:hypothetical protein
MITTTSLKHPTMQIKINSARAQAFMGLVAKVVNAKGKVIMVSVLHKDTYEPSFYLIDSQGGVGKDVTAMVLEAVPYAVVAKKVSLFKRMTSSIVNKAQDIIVNLQANSMMYSGGLMLAGLSF